MVFFSYSPMALVVFKVFWGLYLATVQGQNQVCPVAMDTVFLLDGSSSIGSNDFVKLKDFIIDVLQHFRISEQESRIGIILYSDVPLTKVYLTDDQNTTSLYSKISAMPFIGGNTHTDLGLNASRHVFLRGWRNNVLRVLVVITDGESNGGSVVLNSRLIKDDGIIVLTLGIGSGVNSRELTQMATASEDVYQFASADQLLSQRARIASAICAASRNPQLYFTSVSRHSMMSGHVITSAHVIDDVACAFKCLNNEQCFSFDYMSTSGTCQLNYSNKRATPDDVIANELWIHYDMTFSLQ